MFRIDNLFTLRRENHVVLSDKSQSACRTAISALSSCLLILVSMIQPAAAVDFVWNTASSGNWTTAANWDIGVGHPDGVDDSATISPTGSAYNVTLDASKTIGQFAMTSADATLNTGANTLLVDGNASTTASPGLFSHTAGVLNGNFQFITADVNLNNVTSTAATVFDFRQFTGSCCGVQSSTIDFGTNEEITANQTLRAFGVDSRGIIDLTTVGDVTNLGTVDLTTQGISSGGNQNHIIWNLTGGELSNFGTVTMASTRGSGSAQVRLNADFTNEAGGTFNAQTPSSGQIILNKAGATHVNAGDWNVTGTGDSLIITGGGTSFTQSTGGASLDASRMIFGADTDASANTFTVSAGSMAGNFEFGRSAVSLVGATISGPTTLLFEGEVDNTLALSGDTLAANMTLNVIGRGISEGSILNMAGNLNNSGTILVQSPSNGADFNAGLGRLILDGGTGTLTNGGALTVETRDTGNFNTFADLNANLVNQSGGVVDLLVSGTAGGTGTDRARLNGSLTNQDGGVVNVSVTSGGGTQDVLISSGASSNTNAGTLNLIAGTLDVNSAGFTNAATGVIRGVGTLDVLGTTGGLTNEGSLSPGLTSGATGVLNVTGDVSFGSSGQLVIDVIGGGATAGVDYDQLAIGGTGSNLGNTTLVVNVSDLLITSDLAGDSLTIMTTFGDDLTGEMFDSVMFSGKWVASVEYLSNSIVLSNFAQVPEPGTGLLLLFGLGLVRRVRRRREG